jgi:kynurenine formamidase
MRQSQPCRTVEFARRASASLALLGAMACAPAGDPAPSTTAPGTAVPPPDLVAMLAEAELVDLTHTFDTDTLVWPTSDAFRLEKIFDGTTPGGWHYAANNVHTAEHGGTHLDAPIHFAAGQQTAEQVPLTRLIGRALVVDVSTWSVKDADYLVTVERLTHWESQHGTIERGSLVLLRTGQSTHWPNAEKYLGTALRGAQGVAQLHFPGLHPDAATFLVEERQVGAVGIDTASIDRGQSTTFEAHRILAAGNVPAFENLTNLDRVPTRGAVVVALPMKVGGGSGGPLRAVAIVPKED